MFVEQWVSKASALSKLTKIKESSVRGIQSYNGEELRQLFRMRSSWECVCSSLVEFSGILLQGLDLHAGS